MWREQFGRAIIESQSCGVPVIDILSGAIPDVIGKGGWVVSERDPKELAALFDRLSGAPDDILAKGQLGLENVATRFTYEKRLQRLRKPGGRQRRSKRRPVCPYRAGCWT